ncbi:MAG: hypothetical protein AAF394_02415, partial [Planctomycetota bacterium]
MPSAVIAPRLPKSKPSLAQPKQTFRRKCVEAGFLKFCQLSTVSNDVVVSKAEFREAWEEAQNHIPSEEFTQRSAESSILENEFLDVCEPE